MNIGRLNFRLTRVQGHLAKVQWLMVTYLTLDSLKLRYGVSFWWIFLIVPVVLIVAWIDKRWIYPREAEAAITAVPWNQELMRKLDSLVTPPVSHDEISQAIKVEKAFYAGIDFAHREHRLWKYGGDTRQRGFREFLRNDKTDEEVFLVARRGPDQ
jgi:hypothetical protein